MLVVCLGVGCAGCGGVADAPSLAAVKGKVSLRGKPLGGASVLFHPEKGPMANGQTDSEGNFTVTTSGRPGATIGKCKVTVSKNAPSAAPAATMKPEDMMEMQKASGGQTELAKNEIPEKYDLPQASPLEALVDKDAAKNVFEFPLVD